MTDLNALIGNVEAPAEQDDLSTNEVISQMTDNMIHFANALDVLSRQIQAIDAVVNALNHRTDTIEKHMAYLLSKDPVLGPKMAAIADQLAATQAEPK
jgi:ABC-type transporter Mla subunit MlaD